MKPKLLKGFTLLELLVVVAIIAVLVAIGIPVVISIRNSAGSAKTVSNLHQIQVANELFAADNNGFYVGNDPSGSGIFSHPWFSYMPFVSLLGANDSGGEFLQDAWVTNYPEVLRCGLNVSVAAPPRDDRQFTIAMNMTGWTNKNNGEAVGNWWEHFGPWSGGKIHRNRVNNPAQLIMFYESGTFTGYLWDRLEWKGDEGKTSAGMAFRNKGGVCYAVFADGHTGGFTREDVEKETRKLRQHFWWDAE